MDKMKAQNIIKEIYQMS